MLLGGRRQAMTRPGWAARSGLLAALLSISACGGRAGARATLPAVSPGTVTRETGDGRPPLAVVEREGDPRGAIGVAVTMEGIAAERGAMPAVALAALVEARLRARGIDASATGGWGGWRLSALVASPDEAVQLVDRVREAMLAPVVGGEAALVAVARKVSALTRRPLPDRALVGVVQCTGEAFGTASDAVPDVAELERWRRASLGLGRVAFASAGDGALAGATAHALVRAPAWPAATPGRLEAPSVDARAVVYDASGELPPGAARIVVTVRTATAEQAVAAAPSLGDPLGPLASRLAALDAPARVRSVVATAHADGGCVAATLDLAARDLIADTATRIAIAAALARQELSVELADITPSSYFGRDLAARAADPREAAERAAWWTLAGRRAVEGEDLRTALTVGVAAPRDVSAPGADPSADQLRSEIDRATIAWHAPAVESRTRIERGQGEAWILFASTCGVLAEAAGDAGAGAAVALAAASRAGSTAADASVEPYVTTDGVGVLAHGPARVGESAAAHARRLGDLAARAFAADPLDPERIVQARTALLVRAGNVESRALGALGDALAPGHPSWVEPFGTRFGLASASEDAIVLRSSALRAGPLRVAVLANTDPAQAEAAVRAVDRWVARRPAETRACPPMTTPVTPRPGTYAIDLPAGAPSEALLALPLTPSDDGARVAAIWMAAALDGPDGLLAHALGGVPGDAADPVLAHGWSAALVGAPRSPALVVRLTGPDASLDGAVAQTRNLLDRIRQGGLREADRSRAAQSLARSAFAESLDPRARTLELWRSEPGPTQGTPSAPSAPGEPASPPGPSLEALRAFAAASLHDEALVIVAARPPRLDPGGHPFSGHPAPIERHPRTREPR
jgi:hypothetical protein